MERDLLSCRWQGWCGDFVLAIRKSVTPEYVFVLQGTSFFDGLLQKLQVSYQFKLEDYMDGMVIRTKPLRKMVGWLPPRDFSSC